MRVVEFGRGIEAMAATRKFVPTLRFLLAGTIVMYGWVVFRIPSSATPHSILLRALTVVAVSMVILIFVIRKIQVLPAEAILQTQPQDARALARLRMGYLLTYALSLSIALYGLVLHFLGFSTAQIAPFFIAGFALIVFFGPKMNADGPFPPQSGPITSR
jgi:hypothetical protein